MLGKSTKKRNIQNDLETMAFLNYIPSGPVLSNSSSSIGKLSFPILKWYEHVALCEEAVQVLHVNMLSVTKWYGDVSIFEL